MKKRTRSLILIAIPWLAAVTALVADAAETSGQGWRIEALMAALSQVKSAEAHFVERKYSSLLTEPLETSGTIVYVAPDRLEKRTLAPRPESFVIERGELTIEGLPGQRRRTMRIQSYPELAAFIESIRATLAGDVQGLRRFYDVTVEGTAEDWKLLLRPTVQRMQRVISLIRIAGREAELNAIEIEETDGDRSVMTVVKDNP